MNIDICCFLRCALDKYPTCVCILLNKGPHVLLLVLTTILRSTGLMYDPHFRDEEDTGSEMIRALHTLKPKLDQLQNKPSPAHQVHAPSCTLAAVH